MRILKKIATVILVIIGAYFIWALLSPKEMEITRSIEINKDQATVKAILRDFKFFDKWSPFNKTDLVANYEIIGDGSNIGDMYKWDGDTVGQGQQTFVYESGDTLARKLEFFKPFASVADDYYIVTDLGDNKTKVVWSHIGPTPFMLRPIVNTFIKSKLEAQFDSGLADLKSLIESIQEMGDNIDIQTEDFPETNYIAIRFVCKPIEISKKLAEAYQELAAFSTTNALKIEGMPFAIYYRYDPDGDVEFEAAMQVSGKVIAKGRIKPGKIEASKALVSTFYGPYEKTGDVHYAMDNYAKEHKIKIDIALEIYENDPTTVAPEQIQTKIIYPFKEETI